MAAPAPAAVEITRQVRVGGGAPLALIAGPCVIESERHARGAAERLARLARRRRIPLVFKASYDKANRTSGASFRGPGMAEGLRILGRIRGDLGLPVLTDVHETQQTADAAEVADVLQIPALLSRQTDLLCAAARTGRAVNVKKGQFMAPEDVAHAVAKVRAQGNRRVLVTERGTSFGYHRLVVDLAGLPALAASKAPVVFDASHSVQLPGGLGAASGGRRELIPLLVRAACAAGVDALFVETHPHPARARSDGPNAWPLDRLEALWDMALAADRVARAFRRPA